MFVLTIQFVFLAGVIVVAGMYLTDAADAIADLTGIGRTLAGLVLLAAATSLPELAVDCAAVVMTPPAPDLAVGALVGSSLFNLLILGVLDLFHRHDKKILSPVCEEHTLSAVTSMVATALVILFIILGSQGMKISLWQVGLGPVMIMFVYVASLRLIYFDQKQRQINTDGEEDPVKMSGQKAIGLYLGTTFVVFLAAYFLAPTAEQIAKRTGLGETFVGSIFVALTTSLPEVVTTLAAVRLGAFNMAMGNVVGSNNFNMAILLPVDMAYRRGELLADATLTHVVTGSIVVMATSILLLAITYKPKRNKWLWFMEPSAGIVVLLSLSGWVLLYFLRPPV